MSEHTYAQEFVKQYRDVNRLEFILKTNIFY